MTMHAQSEPFPETIAIARAHPKDSVFIDDREQTLPPARSLGMRTVRFTSAKQLAVHLAALGIAIGDEGHR